MTLQLGNSTDIQNLVCSADARYGRGAKALDTTLAIGSVGLMVATFGLSLVPEGAAGVAGLTDAAMASRATGLISVNATRVLQVASLGVNSLETFEMYNKSCRSNKPSLVAKKSVGGRSCVSAPRVEELSQISCSLAASLAVLGVAAPLALPKIARLVAGKAAPELEAAAKAPTSREEVVRDAVADAANKPRLKVAEQAAEPAAKSRPNPWLKKYTDADGNVSQAGKDKARELADKYRLRELDEHRPPELQKEIEDHRVSIEKNTNELDSLVDQYKKTPDDPIVKKAILRKSREVADEQKLLLEKIGKPDNQVYMAAASPKEGIPPRWALRSKDASPKNPNPGFNC